MIAIRMLLLCLALAAASGCSMREYALRSVGDALAGGGDTYAADDDVELIGAATPSLLDELRGAQREKTRVAGTGADEIDLSVQNSSSAPCATRSL